VLQGQHPPLVRSLVAERIPNPTEIGRCHIALNVIPIEGADINILDHLGDRR
jgi:hypothetical protein